MMDKTLALSSQQDRISRSRRALLLLLMRLPRPPPPPPPPPLLLVLLLLLLRLPLPLLLLLLPLLLLLCCCCCCCFAAALLLLLLPLFLLLLLLLLLLPLLCCCCCLLMPPVSLPCRAFGRDLFRAAAPTVPKKIRSWATRSVASFRTSACGAQHFPSTSSTCGEDYPEQIYLPKGCHSNARFIHLLRGKLATCIAKCHICQMLQVVGLSYIGPVLYASTECLVGEAMSWAWPLRNNMIRRILLMTASTCSLLAVSA